MARSGASTSRAGTRSRSSGRGRSGCRRPSSPARWARASSRSMSVPNASPAPRSSAPGRLSIRALTHGGADCTLDTSSQPEGRIAAVRSAKVWGTCCFVGERNQVTIDVSPDMLRKQLTIIGSWTFSWQGQAECARFIVERNIDVDRLFTHHWKLEQAAEAYRLFDTQTTGKGVFLM